MTSRSTHIHSTPPSRRTAQQAAGDASMATTITMSAIAAMSGSRHISPPSAAIVLAMTAARALAALDEDAARTVLLAAIETDTPDPEASGAVEQAQCRLIAAHQLLARSPEGRG